MSYINYIHKSLQIFLLCFIIGSYVNNVFIIIQKRNPQINTFVIAVLQLITIISITYLLRKEKIFHSFFEEYSPNVLFSTFLVSLQTNMINNFKSALSVEN